MSVTPTRAPINGVDAIHKLSELGALGDLGVTTTRIRLIGGAAQNAAVHAGWVLAGAAPPAQDPHPEIREQYGVARAAVVASES